MGLKKMLVLLALGCVAVIALGVYVVFFESTAPTTEEALKERGLVFKYKDDQNRTIRDVATRLQITRTAAAEPAKGPGKAEGEKKAAEKKEPEKKAHEPLAPQTVLLEKAGALAWRMKKPTDARADRSAVLAILDALKNVTIESIVTPASEGPDELAKFGLKEPRLAVAFWLGDKAHEFVVGSEVKGQKAYEKRAYIRLRDDKRVLVVPNDLIEKLSKGVDKLETPDDAAKWVAGFRDKKVFERERDPERATALRAVTTARTLELEKADKAWHLKAPVADLADLSKVSGLLSKARNLEVEKYISEDPSKLADYGLDKPQLTCEVKAEDGSTMALLIGKATEGDDEKLKDQLYAKRAQEPSVFTIKKDFLSDLDVKLDDVRARKVASFEDGDVTAIEIARGSDTLALARESSDKDWKLTKPHDAKAYQAGVSDVLRHLGKLRVARWIDDSKDPAHEHLKQPEAVVTLLREAKAKPGAKDQPPVKLYFSAIVKKEKEAPKQPEKDGEKPKEPEGEKPKDDARGDTKDEPKEIEEGRYVRREGQTALLYIAAGKAPDGASYDEKDSVEALNGLAGAFDKGYLAFLDRQVFDFKEADVVRLTIERDAAKLVCEKKDDAWKLTSPVALDAEKNNVTNILGAMNDLAADDYVAESPKPEDLARYGLDKPQLRLTASIEEEEKGDEAKKDDAKADEKAKAKEQPKKKAYTKTLLVSRKLDGKTHGMEQGGTLVFTIKSWDADSLRTEVISTTLGDFAEADAASLTIAHRGKPEVVIEKEKDKDTWAITKPKQAEADQDAVKKVLDALHDLRGRRCIDYDAKDLAAHGLEPPEVVVTVKIKDKPDLVLKIGKELPDEKDDPGFAAVRGDAKQVFLMPKGKVEDIAKTLGDLEKKPEPKAEEPPKEEPKKEEPKAEEPTKKQEPAKGEPKAEPAPKGAAKKAPAPKGEAKKAPAKQ